MNIIICTSVNPPTEAIKYFDSFSDWHLVVVGDKKTPPDYHLVRGTYLSPADQEAIDPDLSEAIGWNCTARRNFGFLWAARQKPDIVAIVDDDNVPKAGWGTNLMIGQSVPVHFYENDLPVFDPIGATNYHHLWHRGYPLQLLTQRDYSRKSIRHLTPMIQADFWDGDPDVDAICRLEHAPECHFDPACFPIASNTISPFNSQNTFISADLLKHYFMFPFTGRVEDIWASYYLQAVTGATVVYGPPSVYQARNQHDLTADMEAEFLAYSRTLDLVRSLLEDPDSIANFVSARAMRAFQLYRRHFA